jgi:hypothetical protein
VVIGVDQGGNKYLLDGVRHRMKLTDRWEFIKSFKRKWEAHSGVQMVRIGYERYGMQVDLEIIEDMMVRENNHFKIEELNTPRQGRHSKDDRIERLEPDIREGRFYLPGVAYHPDQGADCYWAVWNEEMAERAAKKGEKKCVSAWNKDPVFGVIGIQSGPRGLRVHTGFHDSGSRGWDADCGDDCKNSPRVFCPGQADQSDLP